MGGLRYNKDGEKRSINWIIWAWTGSVISVQVIKEAGEETVCQESSNNNITCWVNVRLPVVIQNIYIINSKHMWVVFVHYTGLAVAL